MPRKKVAARCPDHLGGPLSPGHWLSMREQEERLDHRASSTTALLAYAAAGVLPSMRAQPLHRSSQDRLNSQSRPLPPSPPQLTCAVCRIAANELALAAAVARRCLGHRDAAALLAAVPKVLCEHLSALGYLGHTERRVMQLQPACDSAVAAEGGDCAAACSDGAVGHGSVGHGSGSGSGSGGANGGGGGGSGGGRALLTSGELPGWPALLQALLDQEGAPPLSLS